MAASLNKVQLIGNLGKDPEIRSLNSGDRVANFSIACTESWTKNGEKNERTEWVNVVVWGSGLVGVIEQYVRKGSKIYIEGQFRTRKWQDKDSKDHWSTEVVVQGPGSKILLLGDPKGERSDSNQSRHSRDDTRGYDSGSSGGFSADLDDEIPF